jgi:hypothetical protein
VTPRLEPHEAEQQIREFHDLGLQVIALTVGKCPSRNAVARAIADEQAVSFDHAQRAHQFARKFKPKALKKLCELCHAPGNTPLSISHIRRALRAGDSSQMLEWLERAARKGWNSEHVDAEMKRKSARKAGRAGPRFIGQADLLGTLHQLEDYSDKSLKRYDALWGEDAHWLMVRPQDDPQVPDRVKEVRKKLRKLQKATEELNERLKKIGSQTRQKPQVRRVSPEDVTSGNSGHR